MLRMLSKRKPCKAKMRLQKYRGEKENTFWHRGDHTFHLTLCLLSFLYNTILGEITEVPFWILDRTETVIAKGSAFNAM